jgi:hypothetical protein
VITQVGTRITWPIRPVVFLPLDHRQGANLPVCAYELTPLTHRLSYNLLYWFKAARSAHRARPGPRPGLRSSLRPAPASPAGARAAHRAISHLTPEKGLIVAGAVDSTALRGHFGASLEDHDRERPLPGKPPPTKAHHRPRARGKG